MTTVLRWTSAVMATITASLVIIIAGVMVDVRDTTLKLEIAIRQNSEKDEARQKDVEATTNKVDRIFETTIKHGMQISEIMRRMNMR